MGKALKARKKTPKRGSRRPTTLISFARMLEASDRAHERLIMQSFKRFRARYPELANEMLHVWGDDARPAARWLCRPRAELGDVSPLRAAAEGRQEEVRRVLGRMEHGVHG
jgi:uncharacterized protein (DUF2384 family)